MNDKIRLITRRDGVELTSNAIELLENESITNRRRAIETAKHTEVIDYEQTQIVNAIETEKTYCNSIEGLNLTILPKYGIVRIEYNPNKLQGKKPTELLTFDELKDTFEIVETRLSENGIKTDINHAQIKAYHNSFDVATNRPYKDYKPILVQSLSNRTIPQGRPRFEYDTFYIGNKSNEITAYNKQAEYKANTGLELGFECMRFESRHNRIEKLHRHTPNSLTADVYLHSRQSDKQAIYNQIFDIDFHATATALGLLNHLIENCYKSNEILKALASQSIGNELIKLGIDLNKALVQYPRTDIKYKRRNSLLKSLTSVKFDTDEALECFYELKNKFKAVA